ncbi:hypothetical protein P886_3075 [Alteromonadaceae bacterium 2753L.S.0a.02]|nr:hypothetical protein P886_3075 [Alteromonadaceae bacterium 2753L.S.0a.02]
MRAALRILTRYCLGIPSLNRVGFVWRLRLNNLLSKTETTVFRCHEFLDSLEESSLTKAQKAISRSEVTKKIDDLCTLRSEARQHLALESNDVLKQVKTLSKIGNEHLDLQQLIKLYLNSFAAWIHANGLCESVEEIRLLTESALDIQIKLTGIDEEKNELKRAIRVELAERKEAIPEEMVARLKEFGIDCGQNEVNSEKKGQPKD